MKSRPGTIGPLGRASARVVPGGPVEPRRPTPPPSGPERGAIRRWLRAAFVDNVGIKFVSVVLAVTVFLLVGDDKDREITVRVGVLYNLPKDKVLVSERVDEVQVTIRGPWRRLRKFDERALDRISLDPHAIRDGKIELQPSMIDPPSGLSVVAISPRSIAISFDNRVERLVDVSPALAGQPRHGYVVREVKPAPATAKIRGAERQVAAVTAIRSRPLAIEGRDESFAQNAQLIAPEGVELLSGIEVSVQVEIDEELVTRRWPGISVAIRAEGLDPAKWVLTPSHIDLTLTGALLAVEKAKNELVPFVRLSAAERAKGEVEVHVDAKLAPGIGIRISPEHVKLAPAVLPTNR